MMDEFKYSRVRDKIRHLLENYEEYMFTVKEISMIISEEKPRVRKELYNLKKEGYVKISEKGKTKEVGNEWYEKEENYWAWSGYL